MAGAAVANGDSALLEKPRGRLRISSSESTLEQLQKPRGRLRISAGLEQRAPREAAWEAPHLGGPLFCGDKPGDFGKSDFGNGDVDKGDVGGKEPKAGLGQRSQRCDVARGGPLHGRGGPNEEMASPEEMARRHAAGEELNRRHALRLIYSRVGVYR